MMGAPRAHVSGALAASRELRDERSRARIASAYLVLAVAAHLGLLIHVALLEVRLALLPVDLQNAFLRAMDDRAGAEGALNAGTFLLGAVFFLRWFGSAFRAARAHGAALPATLGRSGARAFFVPIVSLYRPYQALRSLDAAIDPNGVPEAPPRPREDDGVGGYRVQAAAHATATPQRRAPLRTWWAFWVAPVAMYFVRLFALESWLLAHAGDTLAYVANVGAGVFAIVVIRRLDARLAEYARRRNALSNEG